MRWTLFFFYTRRFLGNFFFFFFFISSTIKNSGRIENWRIRELYKNKFAVFFTTVRRLVYLSLSSYFYTKNHSLLSRLQYPQRRRSSISSPPQKCSSLSVSENSNLQTLISYATSRRRLIFFLSLSLPRRVISRAESPLYGRATGL